MKKKLLLLAVIPFCINTAYGQSQKTFLSDFKNFVKSVEANDTLSKAELAQADSVYASFNILYKDSMKQQFTNDEVEEYTEYRTRYQKKKASLKMDKVTEKVTEISSDIGDGIKNVSSKVSGVFKGIFKKE